MRWSPQQQRIALHEMSLSAGPDIYYSTNNSTCVKAKVIVPLVCLVEGLLRARVPSVIVVHCGKRPLHYFTAFARANLAYVCQRYRMQHPQRHHSSTMEPGGHCQEDVCGVWSRRWLSGAAQDHTGGRRDHQSLSPDTIPCITNHRHTKEYQGDERQDSQV